MGTKVDIDKLSEYADTLRKEYVDLINVMNDISTSIDQINSLSNWDSPAGTEFNKNANVIRDNFDVCFDKQKNLSVYLDKVIGNYRSVQNVLFKAFQYFKKGG